MEKSRQLLKDLGYPDQDLYSLPSSEKRFPDGAQYRIELPSVEGPEALESDAGGNRPVRANRT